MASVLVLEPYDGGSHAAWWRGYQQHSQHQISALTMPAQYWQWRLQGGAVTLARLFSESAHNQPLPDLIIGSSMLNLGTFLALTRRQTANIATAIYFHENQLTYPPGPRVKHDLKLGFINYSSALVADRVFFNSLFHRDAFLAALPNLLKHYADFTELETVDQIAAKSEVLPLGIDLRRLDAYAAPKPSAPVLLWNHRWEYDKAPDMFINALRKLSQAGHTFSLILAGEQIGQAPASFSEARAFFGPALLHYGYAANPADYARLLWGATHVISAAWQEFFGVSTAEAIYCGCLPILPRRLNYPALVPAAYHDLCLYDEGHLAEALAKTLHTPAPAALRQHISQYDWQILAPHYDRVLLG
jgi:glycosyltransferase involved in cell wall biosynthesis